MSPDDRPTPERIADPNASEPEPAVGSNSDPLATTAAGDRLAPSSDELQHAALKALVKSKMFATSRTDEAPRIGRYAVLKILGEGGMGAVYACFDERLDRRVALKLVKGAATEESRRRMLREAQAMAKLSHPNVVPVFEVGEHDGALFVAMEYVHGMTLARWQTEEKPGWRDVLEKYVQAGRGLAAAHAAGLVHRDFKPHNAVVGADGRVRVLDFGLAFRQGHRLVFDEDSTIAPRPADAVLDTPLTETGTVMGTPAYMAPEQFLGGAVDARSDQFSLCVALWEGLFGARPFEGKNPAELFAKSAEGRVVEPGRTEVPAAIIATLLRGLRPDAGERWPDLSALLVRLEATAGAARRAKVRVVALALGIFVFALAYFLVKRAADSNATAGAAEAAAAEANTNAEQQTELAKRARRDTEAAQISQRNALLVAAARLLERSPAEVAALLREAEGADPAAIFGWAQTATNVLGRKRLLRALLEGHTDKVLFASFSPDGARIVTASMDDTARVWNADGSGTPTVLAGHTDTVLSARFSPDGKRIVTASLDRTARVWNADGSGTPIVLAGHAESVDSASFSPDGTRIVTASSDKTARVWNADGTGTPIVLAGHTESVNSASFSPDGTRIVTWSWDKTARVWSADGSGTPTVLAGHAGRILSASFGPDGTRVLTGSEDKTARVWNADGSGTPTVLEGHTEGVIASFSPDGTRIVTTCWDKTARVWSADGSGTPIVLEGHTGEVESASFSPDGTRILTVAWDKTARVWNADGSGTQAVLEGHTETISSAAFSPDGTRIVTASYDKTARVWNPAGVGAPTVLVGHENRVTSASFSPDATRIVTTSWDKTARTWNIDSGGTTIDLDTVLRDHDGVVSSA